MHAEQAWGAGQGLRIAPFTVGPSRAWKVQGVGGAKGAKVGGRAGATAGGICELSGVPVPPSRALGLKVPVSVNATVIPYLAG